MTATKYSRQREAILKFLRARKDHPTAETIYQNLKADQPSLSLGTVYRNLTKLIDAGTIIKISSNDTSDHFDGCVEPHAHFICNHCHCIIDLTIDTLNFDNVENENMFSGKIETSQILFYGTCKKCMNN